MFREANSQTKYFRWKLQLTVMCTKYIWTIWKNVVLECNIYIYNDTQSLIIFQKWYSPPPKGGYVFGRVSLCAYMFVCLSVIRIANKVMTGIASNTEVCHEQRNNWLHFGMILGDGRDYDPEPGSALRSEAKLIFKDLCLGPRKKPLNFGDDPDYDLDPLHSHCDGGLYSLWLTV